ncbi:MAG: hypothetical protein WBF93_02340 [Pirellulales bacterium]
MAKKPGLNPPPIDLIWSQPCVPADDPKCVNRQSKTPDTFVLPAVNRLDLPGSLRRCLSSTNLIDASGSGVRQKTRRITNWKNGAMALRWAAAAFVETEKNYRRIMGYQQLWMLKAALDESLETNAFQSKRPDPFSPLLLYVGCQTKYVL